MFSGIAKAVYNNWNSSMFAMRTSFAHSMIGSFLQEALGDSTSLSTTISDSLPYMLSSLSDSAKIALGYQINDTIKTCFYNQQPCNMQR